MGVRLGPASGRRCGGVGLHGLLGVTLVVLDYHLALAVRAAVARVRLEEGAAGAHELPALDALAGVARARGGAEGEAEGGGAEEGGRERERREGACHPFSPGWYGGRWCGRVGEARAGD